MWTRPRFVITHGEPLPPPRPRPPRTVCLPIIIAAWALTVCFVASTVLALAIELL